MRVEIIQVFYVIVNTIVFVVFLYLVTKMIDLLLDSSINFKAIVQPILIGITIGFVNNIFFTYINYLYGHLNALFL
jgi:hypothetical protein